MNIRLFLMMPGHKWRMRKAKQTALLSPGSDADPVRADWNESLKEPTAFYLRCHRFFHRGLPPQLRVHREYFSQNRRGFGEDAFHVMWFVLFREFHPRQFLEIGVYRGQTISLAAMLSELNRRPCEVHGISPFSNAGDSVSKYRAAVDYREDTLRNFAHFRLPAPQLLKAYSTDPAASELIRSQPWDMIYIDGNHDYEIVQRDSALCAAMVRPGGLIIMDDAGLNTGYRPPLFAPGGHPGPSRLAHENTARQST